MLSRLEVLLFNLVHLDCTPIGNILPSHVSHRAISLSEQMDCLYLVTLSNQTKTGFLM